MNCKCHGEPQYWNKDARYRAGGFWLCAVKKRERVYWNLDGAQYARVLLRNRRYKALKRCAERHERRRASG